MNDCALVLGGADCTWQDVGRLEGMIGSEWPGVVVAANDSGIYWPGRLDHWVSYHPEKFERICPPGDTGAWKQRRHVLGHPGGYTVWGRRAEHLVDRLIDFQGGSSGLLAVAVAREVGCRRVVLCGVPMDARPHFHDAHGGGGWSHADTHWRRWKKEENDSWLRGMVRSMSGRTRERYGEPTLEWLNGEIEDV